MSNDSLADQLINGHIREQIAKRRLDESLPSALCGDVSQCPFFAALKSGERCSRFHDIADTGNATPVRRQCIGAKPRRI